MRRSIFAVLAAAVAVVAFGVIWSAGPVASRSTVGSTDQGADPGTVGADEPVELIVFHGDGCPHCARMLTFLDELDDRYPTLVVVSYEVWYDRANQVIFGDVLAGLGESPSAVPTVVVGDRVFVGYQSSIAREIEAVVDDLAAGRTVDVADEFTVDVPFVGDVDVGSRSLVGATVLIAFVDGVNPCSLWVLSMLMALVVHSGSRLRVFAVGGLFLLVTSLLYGLYMLGAYSALSVVGSRGWIRAGVALVAGAFGALHLKEYWTTRGPSVAIAADRKPGLFRRMRALADTDRSLPATLGGTAVLAVGVSLLETPCTAGLPLLWTDLLAERDVAAAGAAVLFGIYLLVFLVDELLLFGAAVVTLRATKMQERHGQVLQLVGGTLMLTLAGAMVLAPELMESVGGTAVVFAGAASLSGVLLLGERIWHHRGGGAGPKFSGTGTAARSS